MKAEKGGVIKRQRGPRKRKRGLICGETEQEITAGGIIWRRARGEKQSGAKGGWRGERLFTRE